MQEQQLLDTMIVIIPAFQAHWEDEDNYYISDRGTFNLHNVCTALAHFYIDHAATLSAEQQQALFDCVEKNVTVAETADAIHHGFIEAIALTPCAETAATCMGPQARLIMEECQAHD